MKRAKTKIAAASFLQFYEAANDFNNVDAAENLLYGILCNQDGQITKNSSVERISNFKLQMHSSSYICSRYDTGKIK
jgi:hypothetical protein